MTPATLDYPSFQELITRFATDLPEILITHPLVADLIPRVDRLLSATETPFTIAIIGQMRAGKSSLINALVGANLAVTGVNETTATVNWFKYATSNGEPRFRAVWSDRPAEEFPLSEIKHWVGDSERAKYTRYLEFFADAPFLKTANIVDTPGTRSVLIDHTRTVQDFLTIRQERHTRADGESADAIVYVLMPVARQSDADMLIDFEKNSRMPGSSPYNSLAVVHKWEILESADPYSNALQKCDRVQAALKGMVSQVLPVSAPLSWAAEHFQDSFWQTVLTLTTGTSVEVLEDLLLREEDFLLLEEPSCPLNASTRKALRSNYQLPWASFKAILSIARQRLPSSAMRLQQEILLISGIVELREALDKRFLNRARLIKGFTLLSKAWEPCQIAQTRLRNHKQRNMQLLEDADQAKKSVEAALSRGAIGIEPVLSYIQETRQTVERDGQQATHALRRLGDIMVSVQDAYGDMNADLQMLELLDQTEISTDWIPILRGLFGYDGPDVSNRIASLGQFATGQTSIGLTAVESIIGRVRNELHCSKSDVKKLFEHALSRLQQIADILDS